MSGSTASAESGSGTPDNDNLAFVDAHHHFWDLDACHYPWLMARGERRFFGDPTPIQQNYLPADLLAESPRYRPLQSVHIQVGTAEPDQLRETQWLSSLGNFPHAIVAACDLAGSDRDRWLEEQKTYPKLRGIRQILGRQAEEDRKHNSDRLIDDPEFERGLARLAALDLSFDLQLIPPQMCRVADLLARVPDLSVVLCHCGSPWDQSDEGIGHWEAGLRALAELPGLCCKVSGLGMFNPGWRDDQLEPIIHRVIDAFGPGRVMFGSNFPVDKLYGDYETLWAAYERALARYTHAEKQQMLVATATDFYRL